jgi:hypothetical protein
MKGQISRRVLARSGAVVFDVVVELPRAADGRRRRFIRRGFTTQKAAQAKVAEVLTASTTGTYVEPDRVTLGQYLDAWGEGLADVKHSTATSYRSHITNHITPELGGVKLQQLTSEDVRRFQSDAH